MKAGWELERPADSARQLPFRHSVEEEIEDRSQPFVGWGSASLPQESQASAFVGLLA